MTPPDPIELLRHLAQQPDTSGESLQAAEELNTDVQLLAARSDELTTNEILDQGIGLITHHSGANGAVLFRHDGDVVRVVRRLRSTWSPRPEELPADWFPWSLGNISPTRFLFVADSRSLPTGPGAAPSLGDIGVQSCVHLPILERSQPAGALQLYWSEPLAAWDDAHGPTLRNLGRYLIGRATDRQVDLTLT